ncbi:hypothetical protein BDFB_014037, partial [Asbolus verrucosus]
MHAQNIYSSETASDIFKNFWALLEQKDFKWWAMRTLQQNRSFLERHFHGHFYNLHNVFARIAIFLSVLYTVIDVNLFLTVVTFRSVGIGVVAYLYPLLMMTITVMQFVALLVKQNFKWIKLKLNKSRQQWQQSQKGNFLFYSPRKSKSISPASEFRTRSPVLYSVYYIVKGSIDCAALFALVNASSRTRSEVLEFSII